MEMSPCDANPMRQATSVFGCVRLCLLALFPPHTHHSATPKRFQPEPLLAAAISFQKIKNKIKQEALGQVRPFIFLLCRHDNSRQIYTAQSTGTDCRGFNYIHIRSSILCPYVYMQTYTIRYIGAGPHPLHFAVAVFDSVRAWRHCAIRLDGSFPRRPP